MPDTVHSLAEAPVSITGKVLVPSLSRESLLITGRGTTAAEAAMNLREAIAAVKGEPPAAVPDSLAMRLAPLLAAHLQNVCYTASMHILERATKAAWLVLSDAIEWDKHTLDAMNVRSMTQPDLWYTCVGEVCSCPDWGRNHRNGIAHQCKHLLAGSWWKQLRGGRSGE